MSARPHQVIIVGAGIGGLAAAIALRQAGAEVLVLERVPQLQPVGFGITLQSNALQALDRIGLADAVRRRGAELTHASFCLDNGRQLLDVDMRRFGEQLGQPSVCVHRGVLQLLLLEELGRRHVRTGVDLTGIAERDDVVHLTLAGGTSLSADAVIGADGIRSFVRSQLWPRVELRRARYTTWRGICRNDGLVAKGEANESWGCGRRFGFMPLDDERLYWFATETTATGSSADGSQSGMVRRFAKWHGPIGEIVRRTPDGDILQADVFELPRLRTWRRGRVALLGDAAHAMTPNLGQGGAMAIEDAVVLGDAFRTAATADQWLQAYFRRRRRRVRGIVTESRRLGALAQGDSRLTRLVRNQILPRMPRTLHAAHMRQLLRFVGLHDDRRGRSARRRPPGGEFASQLMK